MVKNIKKVNLKRPVDVDKIPIRKDSFFANAFIIEFPLESQPEYEWQTLFEQEWKSSLHLWERKVAIVGDKLLLITTTDQMGEKIEWLKRIIEQTNSRVEKFNETQKFIEDRTKKEELRKHENIISDAIRTQLAIG